MTGKRPSPGDRTSRRTFLATAGAGGMLTLAGCVGGDDDSSENGGTGELSGTIRISGSSTVFPIAQAVGELFVEEYPDVDPNPSRDGSSGGFANLFIPGDSDINNASRRITESEVQGCRDTGFEPVEFEVAKDALTVVVNNENDWIDSFTYDELEQIWTPDSSPELWSEIKDSWPDEPFDLYGPASTSGTFDYFTETILGEAGRIRDDFEGTEEDDQIANGVESNPAALGYLPFAYYTNNPDSTSAVPLSETDSESPVEPSLDAASTGEYPLARPLFFYANDQKVRDKPRLQEFISFYIDKTTDKSLIADQIGYVQSSDQQAQTNQDALQAATDGEYEFAF